MSKNDRRDDRRDDHRETLEEAETRREKEEWEQWVKSLPSGAVITGWWRVSRKRKDSNLLDTIGEMPANLKEDSYDFLPQRVKDAFPDSAKKGGNFTLQYLTPDKQPMKGRNVKFILEGEEVDEPKIPMGFGLDDMKVSRLEDKFDRLSEKLADLTTQVFQLLSKPKEDSGIEKLLLQQIADAKESRTQDFKELQLKLDAEKERLRNEDAKERDRMKDEFALRKLEIENEKERLKAEIEREKNKLDQEKQRYEQDRKDEREKFQKEADLREKELKARIQEVKEDSKERIQLIQDLSKPKNDPGLLKVVTQGAEAAMDASLSMVRNAQVMTKTMLDMQDAVKTRIDSINPPPDKPGAFTERALISLIDTLGKLAVSGQRANSNLGETETPQERSEKMLKEFFANIDPDVIQALVTHIQTNGDPAMIVPTLYAYAGAHNIPILIGLPYERILAAIIESPRIALTEDVKALLASEKAKKFWDALRAAVHTYVRKAKEAQEQPEEPEGE